MSHANETIRLLHETFPGRVFSRFGDQNWPPRFCDLTPLDFFLWGYLKSKSMSTIPQLHVHYKRKLNAASTKFSHNYAERSWKISTKRCTCASKAVEAICPMYYSINNPILYFMIRLKNKYLKTKNSLLYLIQSCVNLGHPIYNCINVYITIIIILYITERRIAAEFHLHPETLSWCS